MKAHEYEELKEQVFDNHVFISSQAGSYITNKLSIHLIDSINKLNCSTTCLSVVMIFLIIVQILLVLRQ